VLIWHSLDDRAVFSSDLYSLGVTAIYMLSGKLPLELEFDLQTGELNWQQYAPHLSPTMVEVIERSTQPTAQNRYATAAEMLAAFNPANAKPRLQAIRAKAGNAATVLSKPVGIKHVCSFRLEHWLKNAAIFSLGVGAPVILLSNLNFLGSWRSNQASFINSSASASKSEPRADSNSPSPTMSIAPSSSSGTHTDNSSVTTDAVKQQNLSKLLRTKECQNCDLSSVNLSGANLSGANLYGANLSNAVLTKANLYHANLYGSGLGNAKLDNANLYQANLSSADLEKATLTQANLSQANLVNSNLENASMNNASLNGGRLASTNLVGASLSNSDLRNAYLSQANFYHARLEGANLTGAIFCSFNQSSCANFDGASLKNVVGLTQK